MREGKEPLPLCKLCHDRGHMPVVVKAVVSMDVVDDASDHSWDAPTDGAGCRIEVHARDAKEWRVMSCSPSGPLLETSEHASMILQSTCRAADLRQLCAHDVPRLSVW